MGATTVEVSELLSRMLDIRKIEHQVLNAKRHQAEAEVVARAGQPGAVTIATNMAGRGTDIKLSDEVKAAGGLAIIARNAMTAGGWTASCAAVRAARRPGQQPVLRLPRRRLDAPLPK